MIEVREVLDKDIIFARKIYCDSFNKKAVTSNLPCLGKIIGIYKDNILIGFCQIDYINDVFSGEKQAYINSLCIDINNRGHGYSDILLKNCIEMLKKENVNCIRMTSNKKREIAHKLYKSNGFEIVDTCVLKRNLL